MFQGIVGAPVAGARFRMSPFWIGHLDSLYDGQSAAILAGILYPPTIFVAPYRRVSAFITLARYSRAGLEYGAPSELKLALVARALLKLSATTCYVNPSAQPIVDLPSVLRMSTGQRSD